MRRIHRRPLRLFVALAILTLLALAATSYTLGLQSSSPQPDSEGMMAAPMRTPVADSLYPYPEQRMGVVAFTGSEFDLSLLHAGLLKLENRGPTEYERSLGLDSCTVILEDTQNWELPDPATYWARIERWVAENPGHLWFVGNEPENPCRFGTSSGEYVQRYHKLYHFIKEHDPSAQVGIGGVVLPSAIRRAWLQRVLDGYRDRYGQPMPVDVWNVHNLLLSECPGECGCPPGGEGDDMPCEPLCCSGGYVPKEFWCERGLLFSQDDQAKRTDVFEQLIWDFRRWMASREEARDKPLIVTEMGVFAPRTESGGSFPHEWINQFMFETFDFMMTATDAEIGYAADGNRLVQRWTWYCTEDHHLNGSLFDGQSNLTDFGLNFANYAARFLPASPTTIFFQRGWTGYVQDCDTQIGPPDPGPRRPTLNIAADGTSKALFKFDLSVLPTDVEVISANLSLRSALHRDVGDMTVHCYGIRRPWEISEATWTNATAATLWEVPGCGGVTDRDTVPVDSVLVTTDNTTYTWDVTDLAKHWVTDPSANYGVVLEGEAAGSGYWLFRSSDQAEDAAHTYYRLRPKLELVVQLPGGTPDHTPTPTATGTAVVAQTPTPTLPAAYVVYLPIIRR
jgi:hypothetical protein